MLTREESKRFWSFLLRKRPQNPAILVISDSGEENDSRAVSLSCAVCDVLRQSREKSIWFPAFPDYKCDGSESINQHVYETLKASRSMVV
jgi:hypothetical protein